MVDSMSERYAKACAGKHHYRSERRAREAAKDSQRIYGVKQNAYPCPFHPRMWVTGSTYPQYDVPHGARRSEWNQGVTTILCAMSQVRVMCRFRA